MRWTALFFAVAVSGCMTAPMPGPQTQPQALGIIFDHDEMVAAMEGQYLWDCTMGEAASDETYRFVLARRVFNTDGEVTLEEAGQDWVKSAFEESSSDIETRIYVLEDRSRLVIRSDGTASGAGVSGTLLARFDSGTCRAGEQT